MAQKRRKSRAARELHEEQKLCDAFQSLVFQAIAAAQATGNLDAWLVIPVPRPLAKRRAEILARKAKQLDQN
jgi:hypothetical protein